MPKSKSYPSILEYLENEDPVLADVFRDCCMENMLSSTRRSGVTLLRPVDDSFRKKLVEGSLGDPTEKKMAAKHIAALIIPINLRNAEDFNLNRSMLQNGIRQMVEVTSVKGGVITFANGSTASKDNRFKDASKDSNLNIYDITGNGLPLDAPAAERSARPTRGGGNSSKRGGYEIEQSRINKDLRFKIAVQIENIYSRDKMSGKRSNAFVECAYSLVYFVLSRCGDETRNNIFLGRMLPYVAYQEIDFYFFIEPHATQQEDDYLVPTSIIAEWWREHNEGGIEGFSMKNIRQTIDGIISNQRSDSAAIYGGDKVRKHLLDEIQNMREVVTESGVRYAVDSVIDQYKKMSTTNSIGNIKHVFPSNIASKYRSNPIRKLMEDELRYVTYKIFRRYDSGGFVRDNYENILGMIGNYMHSAPSEANLRILNPNKIELSVDARSNVSEACSFVQSTNYMFIPLTQTEAAYVNEEMYGKTTRPDIESENIWNTTLDLHERMGTLVDSRPTSNANEKAKQMLENLYKNDASNLDPKMKGILDEMFRK